MLVRGAVVVGTKQGNADAVRTVGVCRQGMQEAGACCAHLSSDFWVIPHFHQAGNVGIIGHGPPAGACPFISIHLHAQHWAAAGIPVSLLDCLLTAEGPEWRSWFWLWNRLLLPASHLTPLSGLRLIPGWLRQAA